MRVLFALLLAGAASPAFAQQADCPPEHAAMGHCTPATPAPAPAPQPKAPAADPHAGHQMPAPAPQPADPHAGHQMPTPAPTPQPADPHAGHQMPAPAPAADIPLGPPPPEALAGPVHAADTAWGRAAMEPGRAVLLREHGDIAVAKLLIDQLETRITNGRDGYFLNAEGWYGGDIDKLWLKTEVEGEFGTSPDQAELQALWSHAIDPWFNLQAGIRYDARPDKGATHLVLGMEGLAPYWIEVDAAAFVSTRGNVTARIEAEHDARITQKLVLQPRAELDFALQDVPREALGAGLSTAEIGLRLRYEIEPNLAPYIGVEYDRAFGNTRKFRRREDEDLGGLSFVAGIRAWF